MGRTITINPVTRIEGHAKVTIDLGDDGSVNTALLQPEADASHPDDTLLVLRNRTLRSGADLALTARFEHDCWPLGAAVHQQHCPSWQLNFASVPVRHRLVAKELLPRDAGRPAAARGIPAERQHDLPHLRRGEPVPDLA